MDHLHLGLVCFALHLATHQSQQRLSAVSLGVEPALLAVPLVTLLLQAGEHLEELALEHHVELHEDDVAEVPEEEYQRLIPLDGVVEEEDDENDEGDGVEGGVSYERPGRQLEGFSAGKGTGGDDEEDVEHGAPHDCSDSHVGDGDEDADDGGEELWRRSAGRHEGGAGNIVADPPPGENLGWESSLCLQNTFQ